MEFSAAEISALLQGELEGDPKAKVHKLAPIEDAATGCLSFIANPKYEKYLSDTKASVVLVGKDIPANGTQATLIRLDDVYTAFSSLLQQVEKMQRPAKTGIEQPSFIAESATIGENVYIGAFAYIGENVTVDDGSQIYPHTYLGDHSKVGKNSLLYSGVKCYSNTHIGDNVILHSGVVLGSDGFGFAPQADGSFIKVPQTGHVVVEDNVEVGANTTIDRATMDATRIAKGAKLDNLIQVAHNVHIGNNTAVAAQAGISGSTKVGKNSLIGGQAGIVGHISIADNTKIGAKAGVGKSITVEGKGWSGRPVSEHAHSLKIQAVTRKLPELYQDLKTMKKQIEQLISSHDNE